MRRTGAVLAAAAFGLVSLVGCSGGDEEYCNQVKSTKNALEGTVENASDPKAMADGMKTVGDEVQKITDVAPSEVKDDWESIDGAITKMTPILEKFKDINMQDPDPAKVAELQKFSKEMQGMNKDLQNAGKAIEKDAKERCNIDLSA